MRNYEFSHNMAPLTGSAIRAIFALLADPKIISLAGGNPSPRTFPKEDIARISETLVKEKGDVLLQYGVTNGYQPFKEDAVAINKTKGIESTVDNILALTGSSQGIELTTKIFCNPGDTILVEDPSFLGALQTFRSYGTKLVGVKMLEDGVDLDDLESKMKAHQPKFFYVIPTFQNPSGKTTSLERRKAILALAKQYDVLILEDDPYGELRFEGEAIPCIKTLDTDGQVILLNSFSKTISPGLRVGYMTADPAIIAKAGIGKQGMDTHTNNLAQATVSEFWREGLYPKHVASAIEFYRPQRDAMLAAIETYFPKDAVYTKPNGGLFVWVDLNASYNATELFKAAIDAGVAYVPGTHFFADNGHDNTLRLNFSLPSVEQIERGCEILGGLLQNA